MDIEDVYALIPKMQCNPGCIDCCARFGIPSRTRVEDERLKAYLKEHGMEPKPRQGTRCGYLSEQGCTIYPVRPLTCRLFGTSPNYRCHLGCRPVRLLHPDEEEELFYHYMSNFF